ncbi:hypothetical protein OEV98_02030 [Caldibacillus lycopersici]|uniref:Uncharacterized protein n=1 Tax=Perspicuibacillus lycopersici TaxID=1325689 RepID=A0AAE3LPH0_9BACI|nr:hypothetical protein [Perspicuibacillus lycopersici]MCU9612339.1 hypothetical protein [Perspicuibacillus lycopersici]
MEWALAILFGISALLFIYSIIKTNISAKAEKERMDTDHIAVLKEIKDLKESIQKLELDNEIILKEAGIPLSNKDKLLKRELLDLYRRNYSLESISEIKQVSVSEIQELLAPFIEAKDGRSNVAHEN